MNDTYWLRRKHMKYYKKVTDVISKTSAQSVIDIGGWKGEFLHSLDCIGDKTCLDIRDVEEPFTDVKYIQTNFLNYKPEKQFDLAICLQVLEHLNDECISEFSEKLFELAPRVIISVPYKWEKGKCKHHCQDPVDLKKLKSWTMREPDKVYIVKERWWVRTGSMEIRVICDYQSPKS